MRHLRQALLAVALAGATPTFALTLLQLDRLPDLPIGPIQRVVSSADGAFVPLAFVYHAYVGNALERQVARVNFTVTVTCQRPECHVGEWQLRFGWNALFTGATLVPGTYEGDGYSGPFEALYNSSTSCTLTHQRLVVHEIDVADDGRVLRFAADFESRCLSGGGDIAGIIRWHAGDAACAAEPDGAACTDANPCTAADACTGGECRGTFAAGPCSALTCDDGNPCTDDTLDAGTCSHQPIQGSCWDVTYRTTLVVSAIGRTCGCRLPSSTSRLALSDDGHFRFPGGELDANVCTTGHVTFFPDEVGTWRARRRARVLTTSNLAEVLLAAENCGGPLGLTLRHYGTRVRVSGDGRRLTGQQLLTGKLTGAPAAARIVSRITALPGTGAPTATSVPLDRIHAAAERCGRRIAACFRQ